MDGGHGRIDIRSAAVSSIRPVDVGLLSARSAVKVRRERRAKNNPSSEISVHIRHFISSLPPDKPAFLGTAVRKYDFSSQTPHPLPWHLKKKLARLRVFQ